MNSFLINATKIQDFYKAIHIDKSTKRPYFTKSSAEVAKAYDPEVLLDYTSYIKELVNHMPILIYSGEFD